MKKIVSVLLVFVTLVLPVRAEVSEMDSIISDTAEFVLNEVTNPQIASIGGEWAVIGLLASGIDIPAEYFVKILFRKDSNS